MMRGKPLRSAMQRAKDAAALALLRSHVGARVSVVADVGGKLAVLGDIEPDEMERRLQAEHVQARRTDP